MDRSDSSYNKHGQHVEIGQVWQDRDFRMHGRKRTVLAVKDGKALLSGPTNTWVLIRRMHKHSTGFDLVS